MSPKFKLIAVLMGATALFMGKPEFHADSLSAGEFSLLAAQDDVLPDTSALLDAAPAAVMPDSNQSGLMALTNPGAVTGQAILPNAISPVETVAVAPGENPFVPSVALRPVAVPVVNQPQTKASSLPFDFSASTGAGGVKLDAAANPVQVQQGGIKVIRLDASGAERSGQSVPADANRAASKVDETALRYYAVHKDLKRLGAEMRRLKSLYPGWQPPEDMFTAKSNVSEQNLWQLYAAGNYAAVRARIAQLQSANPQWQPSDDLAGKLSSAETRTLLNRAFAQKRWQQVIATAQGAPKLMVCNEMQTLWNVGEAFARMKDYAHAFDLYKYILTNCQNPEERLATVQKASLLIPSDGISSLVAVGRVLPDGTSEFEDIGFDPTRRKIAQFIKTADLLAQPTKDELQVFAEFAQRKNSVKDAGLIGWYYYAQEEWQSANAWFLAAATYERDAKSIEGVILTLRNLQKQDEALRLADRFKKQSPELMQQYIEIIASSLTSEEPEVKLDDKDLKNFEKVVASEESALGAQALGWKYLNDGQSVIAKRWFTESVSWKPTQGGVVGLAVIASRTKNYRSLISLKGKYSDEFSELKSFKTYVKRRVVKEKPVEKRQVAEEKKPKKKRFWFSSDS